MRDRPADVAVRPYDPDVVRDRRELWSLKKAFETTLGAGTGDDGKAERYAAKLDDDYRRRWLAWVERCVADEERCLLLAAVPASVEGAERDVVGYVFLLPERLAFVWDGAVVNELYVAPEWRGVGVADDLVDAVVEVAREQDLPLDRLLLDVDPDNARAYSFYERHGFDTWGEILAREL